jgi:hypothetical protein
MLSRERESIIREAVLDGLQVLDSKQILSKGTQPLQVPITLKQTALKFTDNKLSEFLSYFADIQLSLQSDAPIPTSTATVSENDTP